MSRVRVSVLAAAEKIKSELRKDEKFSQGVRLYARRFLRSARSYRARVGRNDGQGRARVVCIVGAGF
ncbi:MAG: hypothetical protein LBT94_06575 [Prevotellaceae bacterium]|nr:hypothetical protein [Prevotellaceae bacterium]